MREVHDDDLILHYYGESEDPEEIRELLASSPELSARYETLRRTLDAVGDAGDTVPERPESYGAEVWEKLQPRLQSLPSRLLAFWGLPLSRSAGEGPGVGGPGVGGPAREDRRALAGWLTAAILLVAVGFFAGRFWPRPGTTAAFSAEARERILVRTMAVHLERSERLLTEVANAETDGSVDLSAERRWAQDLLTANRLYRQITRRGGRPMLSSLLDDLEPFLLELAHSPSEIPEQDLADLRARIEEQALLFKMRVVSQRLERKPRL
jgi:hypothetical protein